MKGRASERDPGGAGAVFAELRRRATMSQTGLIGLF